MQGVRRVVVLVPLTVMKRKDGAMFAARLLPLGLTSYGRTSEDAILAVKKQYRRFIAENRRIGRLEKLLSMAKVQWDWEDEYSGNIPVEDTDRLAAPNGQQHDWEVTSSMAMAA